MIDILCFFVIVVLAVAYKTISRKRAPSLIKLASHHREQRARLEFNPRYHLDSEQDHHQ